MSNNNLKVNNTETKKATIEVVSHPKFEGDMKTNIVSSIDMADIISSLFAPAFADYYGCRVCVNDGHTNPAIANSMPFGTLYVDLFFKDNGEVPEDSKIWKNIVPRGSDNSGRNDLGARFARVNGANNGRAYEVTKQTFEALEEFMLQGNRTNWNIHTQEIVSTMGVYGKEEAVTCISGLNLNKIITKIYGSKTDEGRYEYVASISTMIPGKTQDFIMQVCQLDLSAVRSLQKTLGIYNPNAPQFQVYNR